VVAAVAVHLDAERADLAQAAERVAAGCRAGQRRVRERIVEPHIDAGRAGDPMSGHVPVRERADHRFFEPVGIFLDVVARALQVGQRIGHELARAVVGHLAAAVGLHHRNIARGQHMLGLAGQSLCEHRRVFAQPQLVRAVGAALGGVALHGLDGRQVVDPAQPLELDRSRGHSTTLTMGWLLRVR